MAYQRPLVMVNGQIEQLQAGDSLNIVTATGPAGPSGPCGPVGPLGATGPQGATGATGHGQHRHHRRERSHGGHGSHGADGGHGCRGTARQRRRHRPCRGHRAPRSHWQQGRPDWGHGRWGPGRQQRLRSRQPGATGATGRDRTCRRQRGGGRHRRDGRAGQTGSDGGHGSHRGHGSRRGAGLAGIGFGRQSMTSLTLSQGMLGVNQSFTTQNLLGYTRWPACPRRQRLEPGSELPGRPGRLLFGHQPRD